MFDGSGIDDRDVAWMERDQFVYYVEMERHLGDLEDWPRLRQSLASALCCAFGGVVSDHVDHTAKGLGTSHGAGAIDLLDRARAQHDPATAWLAFTETVWEACVEVRRGSVSRSPRASARAWT